MKLRAWRSRAPVNRECVLMPTRLRAFVKNSTLNLLPPRRLRGKDSVIKQARLVFLVDRVFAGPLHTLWVFLLRLSRFYRDVDSAPLGRGKPKVRWSSSRVLSLFLSMLLLLKSFLGICGRHAARRGPLSCSAEHQVRSRV